MWKFSSSLAIVTLLFVGCSIEKNDPSHVDSWHQFNNDELHFSIQLPPALTFAAKGKEGAVFDTWNVNTSPTLSDYYVNVYSYSNQNCSNIGVEKPLQKKINDGDEIITGKVDYPSDYELQPLIPDCRPYKPFTSAYILCSEHNGITAAFCITQVTDNPELAEQIFRTFRWTDD